MKTYRNPKSTADAVSKAGPAGHPELHRRRTPRANPVIAAVAVVFAAVFTGGPTVTAAGTATPAVRPDVSAAGSLPGDLAVMTSFTPLGPVRVADTRTTQTPLGSGSTLTVQISGPQGVAGVAADASAVALNITATETTGPGFFTVWGDGQRPAASALNVDAAGQTRANFVIAPIAAAGTVSVFAQQGAHIIVDVSGVFVPTDSAAAGRMIPVGPARALDTRTTETPFAAGEERLIRLAAVGVPADASAAVVAITAVGAQGWWSAYAPATPWPGTSVVNVAGVGAPVTALAFIPVNQAVMTVKSLSGGDLIVDVNGYITGPTSPAGTDGLFVPAAPQRILDTRYAPGPVGRLAATSSVNPAVNPFPFGSVAALAANVTVISPDAPGFLTSFPAGASRPIVAATNYVAGQTLATFTVTPASLAGTSLFTLAAADVIVDTSGYFLGAPQAVTAPTDARYNLLRTASTLPDSRWDPCIPIEVKVNYETAPAGARDVINNVTAHVSAATGLQFYVTDTTEEVRTATVTTPAILILFRPMTFDPILTPSVAGFGGAMSRKDPGGQARSYSGRIVIRNDVPFTATMGGSFALGNVLLHEYGHVIGLAHVSENSQIMFPAMSEFGRYQDGDLAGLAVLGAGNGCIAPDQQAVTAEALSQPGGQQAPLVADSEVTWVDHL